MLSFQTASDIVLREGSRARSWPCLHGFVGAIQRVPLEQDDRNRCRWSLNSFVLPVLNSRSRSARVPDSPLLNMLIPSSRRVMRQPELSRQRVPMSLCYLKVLDRRRRVSGEDARSAFILLRTDYFLLAMQTSTTWYHAVPPTMLNQS